MTKPILATLLTCLFVPNSGYSEERLRLEKAWETNASKLIHEHGPDPGGHPVRSLSFSPDGHWLAALVDYHGPKAAVQGHLLILDSTRPEKDPIAVDLQAAPGTDLSWSAPSGLVLADGSTRRAISAT